MLRTGRGVALEKPIHSAYCPLVARETLDRAPGEAEGYRETPGGGGGGVPAGGGGMVGGALAAGGGGVGGAVYAG